MIIREIAEELANLAKQNFEYSWEGNSLLANKAYAQSVKLMKKIVANAQILEELTRFMLSNSSDIYMACQGMLIALSLGVNMDLAKLELKKEIGYECSSDRAKKRLAFEAKMIKENIDRDGFILLYKGQSAYKSYDKGWIYQ